jgi:hypothetical protein
MLYRLAIVSGLLLASFINIVPAALAEVKFSNLQPGVIGIQGGDFTVLETVVPAIVNVNVSPEIAAQITVLPPELVSAPSEDPSGTKRIGFLKFGENNLRSDGSNATASLPTGDTNLELELRVERPVRFTSGAYTYTVNIVVTTTPP